MPPRRNYKKVSYLCSVLDLAEHIEFLLMRHDCVVVSGLGAFLIQEASAYYDSAVRLFYPPHRSLGFNPELRHNDGLLVSSVSRHEGISLDNAKTEIELQVAALCHQLKVNGEVRIGNLGMMYRKTDSDAVIFEPDESSIANMQYDGFKPLEIRTLSSSEEHDSEEITTEQTAPKILTIPTPIKIIASVIVIMMTLGILYSTNGFVRGNDSNFASLDTGLSSSFDSSSHYENVSDDYATSVLSKEIQLNISLPTETHEEESVPSSDKTCDGKQLNDSDRYLLVVASFPSYKSAQRHIDGNPAMKVIEMEGKFRVYVSSARTINDARAEYATISETYPNVWICRR